MSMLSSDMLAPKETNISALFLVFIVLPLLTYFLLGKWSEALKRKERVNLIAQGAKEEALRVEDMAVGSFIPLVHLPNDEIHQCARCFGPATTRCSQCKSVWYCSGRCQIIHWRQVHKLECQQLGNNSQSSSPKLIPSEGSCRRVPYYQTTNPNLFEYYLLHSNVLNASSDFYVRNTNLPESDGNERKSLNAFDSGYFYRILNSSTTAMNGSNACAIQMDLIKGDYFSQIGITSSDESKGSNCSSERTSVKRSSKARTSSLYSHGVKLHKSPKSGVKVSKELLSLKNIRGQTADESRVATIKDSSPLKESNRTMDLTKAAKLDHPWHSEDTKRPRKVKMLFPYEEFVKCFQFEVYNVSTRGLVNCGNSCYANAILQCLMCTKPLLAYLLCQSHSRAGCIKDWCLMCELEQHVLMLRESGGPLSPMNILMHIRSLNSQIGFGSQEDAHEFLRLLVTSMQTICLEGLGAKNSTHPWLQDTTFIQHTFGGRLRSKVKCSRCHHESERHEHMMDLILEINGWVESLEDALTQFTSSEDLDGDNMYRCGRCAAYVRATKQLRIQEAPNILTIVLKRFHEGSHGKTNKCITFPEMLDLNPFMNGTDDMPPLYMLYAVVVHLDTSNASFSGHYISYVKDLQGNWFKVDDTEVYPIELRQVMSEGAYILFYMRSCPRPPRGCNKKTIRDQTLGPTEHCPSEIQMLSSGPEANQNTMSLEEEPFLDHRLEKSVDCTDASQGYIFIRENRQSSDLKKSYAEFSDATSSEQSLFTSSSDDLSFTTERARDSFSTVDCSDIPHSSIFPIFLSSRVSGQ